MINLSSLMIACALFAAQESEPLQTAKLARVARDKATTCRRQTDGCLATVVTLEEKVAEAKAEHEKAKTAFAKAEAEAKMAEEVAEKDITEMLARLEASRLLLKGDKATSPAKPLPKGPTNIYGSKPGSELKGEEQQADEPDEVIETKAIAKPKNGQARIEITVHPKAKVTINGHATKATGDVRTFNTPRLQNGKGLYIIKATWQENGPQTMTKRVNVKAGEVSEVVMTGE